MGLQDIPLRERKMAQTKIELLKAMLAKTGTKKLEDISVKELCESAVVSEATFFNYFSKKSDLLIYFIHLWCLEVIYLSDQKYGDSSGLKKIEMIFELTGSLKTIGNQRIMMEIIAFQALNTEPICIDLASVSQAERLLMFPQYPGIDAVSIQKFEDIFFINLKRAMELGELPDDINMMDVLAALGANFYGLPLIVHNQGPQVVTYLYKKMLENVWKALRVKN